MLRLRPAAGGTILPMKSPPSSRRRRYGVWASSVTDLCPIPGAYPPEPPAKPKSTRLRRMGFGRLAATEVAATVAASVVSFAAAGSVADEAPATIAFLVGLVARIEAEAESTPGFGDVVGELGVAAAVEEDLDGVLAINALSESF